MEATPVYPSRTDPQASHRGDPRAGPGRDDPTAHGAGGAATLTEAIVREAWLRAEALCECRKAAHGHVGRCHEFLIWAERGEAGRGGWEARPLSDPRRPACEILCAACYAKATGRLPMESTEAR